MKIWIVTLCLIYSAGAQAASFNCNKAQDADEKTICANRTLNDKDVEMATKYRFLKGLLAMGGRGTMQDTQQTWLSARKRCGTNVSCLTRQYNLRIQQLDEMYARIDKPL